MLHRIGVTMVAGVMPAGAMADGVTVDGGTITGNAGLFRDLPNLPPTSGPGIWVCLL